MIGAAPFAPGLMIAAPRSGSGKTTLTLGLLRAFRRRGLRAAPLRPSRCPWCSSFVLLERLQRSRRAEWPGLGRRDRLGICRGTP